MKQKSKVYKYFQDFLAYVKTLFGVTVKVFRTDIGTTYVIKTSNSDYSKSFYMSSANCQA
jgi:hypothetical protein